jgi:hypothetical protein
MNLVFYLTSRVIKNDRSLVVLGSKGSGARKPFELEFGILTMLPLPEAAGAEARFGVPTPFDPVFIAALPLKTYPTPAPST